jgi:hypothetical protein
MTTPTIDPVHVYHIPARDIRLLDGEDEYSRRPLPDTPIARPVRAFAFTVYSADHSLGVDLLITAIPAEQSAARQAGESLLASAERLAGLRGALVLRESTLAHGAA